MGHVAPDFNTGRLDDRPLWNKNTYYSGCRQNFSAKSVDNPYCSRRHCAYPATGVYPYRHSELFLLLPCHLSVPVSAPRPRHPRIAKEATHSHAENEVNSGTGGRKMRSHAENGVKSGMGRHGNPSGLTATSPREGRSRGRSFDGRRMTGQGREVPGRGPE